jgi:hypothetical protein
MRPAPREKPPQISPIFISDKVTLHVSREKDGKLRLVDARWHDAKVVQPDGCGQARRGVEGRNLPPTGGAMTPPLKKLRPPSAPPWFFPAIGAAHVHRAVHFSPSLLRSRYALTAPCVMRNEAPPKEVGASTCSSSGPAMKTCLTSNEVWRWQSR